LSQGRIITSVTLKLGDGIPSAQIKHIKHKEHSDIFKKKQKKLQHSKKQKIAASKLLVRLQD